MEPRCIKYL